MLALVVVLGKQVTFARLGLEVKDALSVTPDRLGALLWSDVYNYPLWYLRDLLCMTLLLPLWSLVTRWGVLSVVALCVIYLIGGGYFDRRLLDGRVLLLPSGVLPRVSAH